jgi:hypothetical protein
MLCFSRAAFTAGLEALGASQAQNLAFCRRQAGLPSGKAQTAQVSASQKFMPPNWQAVLNNP